MKKLKLFAFALFIGTTGLFASEMSRNDVENPNIGNQIVTLFLFRYSKYAFSPP